MLDKEGFSSLSSCLTLLNPVILTSVFPLLHYLLSRHYLKKNGTEKEGVRALQKRNHVW